MRKGTSLIRKILSFVLIGTMCLSLSACRDAGPYLVGQVGIVIDSSIGVQVEESGHQYLSPGTTVLVNITDSEMIEGIYPGNVVKIYFKDVKDGPSMFFAWEIDDVTKIKLVSKTLEK